MPSPDEPTISIGYGTDSKSNGPSSEILFSENKSAIRLPYKSGNSSKSYPTRSSVVIEGDLISERHSVKSRSSPSPIDNVEDNLSSKTLNKSEPLKNSKTDVDEKNIQEDPWSQPEGSKKSSNQLENNSEFEYASHTIKDQCSVSYSEISNRFLNEMLLNQEKINNKTDLAKLVKHQPNFRSSSIQPNVEKANSTKLKKMPSFFSENNLVNFFRKTHEKLFHQKSPTELRRPDDVQNININSNGNILSKSPRSGDDSFLMQSSNLTDLTSGFLAKSSSNINSEENGEINQYFKLIQSRLNKEYLGLKSKNESLTAQYESVKSVNVNYKSLVEELEESNTHLLQENKRYLQYSIKHQFLKLETSDLTSKTKNFKKKLLDKEKCTNEFKQKFDELRLIKEHLSKEKEIAFVEVQHNAQQLSSLNHNIKELKGLRDEDSERKFFYNKLQHALGGIRVLFRVKPTHEASCINYLSTDKFLLNVEKKHSSKEAKRLCEFSRVFQPMSTNSDIYEEVTPLADLLVDGYNTCLITYGQTGTGKTYTLFGSERENEGVAHKLLGHVLDRFKEESNWSYILAISIIEIYRNKIFDLLRSCEVEVKDDGNKIVIKDTQEILVDSYSEIKKRLNQADENRHTSSSRLNANSSRGNLIIICRVEGNNKLEKSQTSHGVMMICDTAGFDQPSALRDNSKKGNKSENDNYKSLRALGNVLMAKKDSKNIAQLYESSLLTQVLKPCLSNRTKCCLLATSHCNNDNFPSIFQTVQFCFNAMPMHQNSDHFQQWVLGD